MRRAALFSRFLPELQSAASRGTRTPLQAGGLAAGMALAVLLGRHYRSDRGLVALPDSGILSTPGIPIPAPPPLVTPIPPPSRPQIQGTPAELTTISPIPDASWPTILSTPNHGPFGLDVLISDSAKDDVPQVGGAYKDVRGIPGYEAHHMPSDSVSPLPRRQGPSIVVSVEDHRKTASWGRKAGAEPYRQKQAKLLEEGDFRGAQQMDIDDIRGKFGNKYDKSIDQMLEYSLK
jgi:hypothetical protein